MRRGRKRGQVLVIAAFGMALILLSTQVYIFKVKRSHASSGHDFLGDYVLDIKLGSGHAVVASLINVSNGGLASILGDNLERWEALVAGDYRFGRCDLNSTLASQSPYSQGVWLDWGNEGVGLSSASSDFNLNISGRGVDVNLDFEANVTTTLMLSGGFTVLGGDSKTVTVYLNLLNEGRPALHGSTNLTYQRTPGQWADPTVLDDYLVVDYGNGTYSYSFSDSIEGGSVSVRVKTYDLRGVFVQAEDTLTEG